MERVLSLRAREKDMPSFYPSSLLLQNCFTSQPSIMRDFGLAHHTTYVYIERAPSKEMEKYNRHLENISRYTNLYGLLSIGIQGRDKQTAIHNGLLSKRTEGYLSFLYGSFFNQSAKMTSSLSLFLGVSISFSLSLSNQKERILSFLSFSLSLFCSSRSYVLLYVFSRSALTARTRRQIDLQEERKFIVCSTLHSIISLLVLLSFIFSLPFKSLLSIFSLSPFLFFFVYHPVHERLTEIKRSREKSKQKKTRAEEKRENSKNRRWPLYPPMYSSIYLFISLSILPSFSLSSLFSFFLSYLQTAQKPPSVSAQLRETELPPRFLLLFYTQRYNQRQCLHLSLCVSIYSCDLSFFLSFFAITQSVGMFENISMSSTLSFTACRRAVAPVAPFAHYAVVWTLH